MEIARSEESAGTILLIFAVVITAIALAAALLL